MERIHGTADLDRDFVRPILTIGNFDGLHLGHRAIMETVVGRARALDGEAVVYTFDPHPRRVIQPTRAPRLLTTLDQKCELLESRGVDVVIVEPFDLEFAKITPDQFVQKNIHERIRPVEVYVGYDFHFGRDREGSMRSLTESGPLLGFSVTIVSEVKVAGRDVNSTRIRELLASGAVSEAAELLGRPYGLRGRVVAGDARGRTLGFATANLDPENEVIPKMGVYAGRVRFLDDGAPQCGAIVPAVMNVGVRPTFDTEHDILVEAHLIDFDREIYGRHVDIEFHHPLRPEQKFDDVEALKAQIARDVDQARDWLMNH